MIAQNRADTLGNLIRLMLALIVLTVLLMILARWFVPLLPPDPVIKPARPIKPGPVAAGPAAAAPPAPFIPAPSPPEAVIPAIPRSRLGMDRLIAGSRDLMPLLQMALPDAWRGDGAAEYFASLILRACGDDLPSSSLEDRRDQVARLRRAAQPSAAALDNAEKDALRCKAIWEASRSDIGEGGDWLMKAAQGGYPQAMLDQVTSLDPAITADQRQFFLRSAIASGDADVMRTIASQYFSAGAATSANATAAAALVACDFGADCGPGSDQLIALRGNATGEDAAQDEATVNDWIERHLAAGESQALDSQASDFVGRVRGDQIGISLMQDENGGFRIGLPAAGQEKQ